MFNCCTLFDTGFLTRGLSLYRSLERHCPEFCLYVFAFDNFSERYLKELSLPSMRVISLSEFEDPELLRVKSKRTRSEYCWTCASSTILYVLEKFKVASCTYLDADVCFFSDPNIIEKEMENDSIGITPHRYASGIERSSAKSHGIFCVQYVTIRNDEYGLNAVRWWRERCLEWCHARLEDGKFGDQKYLDDWPSRFPRTMVIHHPGAGMAPWNARRYVLRTDNTQRPSITLKSTNESFPLIFFHYHSLRFLPKQMVNLAGGGYDLPDTVIDKLYVPYIREQLETARMIQKEFSDIDPVGTSSPVWWKYWGTRVYSLLNASYSCHYMKIDKLFHGPVN